MCTFEMLKFQAEITDVLVLAEITAFPAGWFGGDK